MQMMAGGRDRPVLGTPKSLERERERFSERRESGRLERHLPAVKDTTPEREKESENAENARRINRKKKKKKRRRKRKRKRKKMLSSFSNVLFLRGASNFSGFVSFLS